MTEPRPQPTSIHAALESLAFQPDRAPGSTAPAAFARLASYRDGAVFVGHWAGSSEWERHPVGDEVVMVVDGETTMTLLLGDEEVQHSMRAGDLIVVPESTWHRFDTPLGVKVMTVTPQPTEHTLDPRSAPVATGE